MLRRRNPASVLLAGAMFCIAGSGQALAERAPCAEHDPLRRPWFGDTHVHTTLSFDANSQDTRNTPADAYRFARGEAMGIQPYDENGKASRSIQLDRPLDFTAVTDHSEFLGEIRICTTPGMDGYWHPVCLLHRYVPELTFATLAAYGMVQKQRWGFCGDGNEHCYNTANSVWKEIQQAAEDAYDRSSDCRFTSFIAYEWTGTVGSGINLHHNVVFKNEKVPDRALSWIDSENSLTLWDYLEQECVAGKPGCDAISIPHNSNLSAGLMFQSPRLGSDVIPEEPLSREEAERRAHWEPLAEVMQHKGSSECDNRIGWTEDEFCNFEKLPYDSFGGKNTGFMADGGMDWVTMFIDIEAPKTELPQPNNYLRWALKEGLAQQAELGVNSFKYGLIAATDTHIAAPGLTSEKNHPGHGGAGQGAREGVKGLYDELEYGPGGLAVLWAEENTRESLFAAMRRKEAYATSGTRPTLRMFAGWDYDEQLCADPDLVAKGYAGGVPMGGDLQPASGSGAPRIVVSAQQDPGTPGDPGNPLQRIQIIKGWYEDGDLHEKVLDIAGGPNDASVDPLSCQQSGEGHASLCRVWEDSDFNADAPGFYYARVLENPSCRWSQYACVEAAVNCEDPSSIPEGMENCCSADHQPIIQERAWSSPIWYTP